MQSYMICIHGYPNRIDTTDQIQRKFLVVAVNSMSVFSSIGWRRGGGMFCRYANGARLASYATSSEEVGLPGIYRLGVLTSKGEDVSTHVSG
jgi:hypothetical protein